MPIVRPTALAVLLVAVFTSSCVRPTPDRAATTPATGCQEPELGWSRERALENLNICEVERAVAETAALLAAQKAPRPDPEIESALAMIAAGDSADDVARKTGIRFDIDKMTPDEIQRFRRAAYLGARARPERYARTKDEAAIAVLPPPTAVPAELLGAFVGEVSQRRPAKPCTAFERRRLALTIAEDGLVTWRGYARFDLDCPDDPPDTRPSSCWSDGVGRFTPGATTTLDLVETKREPGPPPVAGTNRMWRCEGVRFEAPEEWSPSRGDKCVALGRADPSSNDWAAAAIQCQFSNAWKDLGSMKVKATGAELTIEIRLLDPKSVPLVLRRVENKQTPP